MMIMGVPAFLVVKCEVTAEINVHAVPAQRLRPTPSRARALHWPKATTAAALTCRLSVAGGSSAANNKAPRPLNIHHAAQQSAFYHQKFTAPRGMATRHQTQGNLFKTTRDARTTNRRRSAHRPLYSTAQPARTRCIIQALRWANAPPAARAAARTDASFSSVAFFRAAAAAGVACADGILAGAGLGSLTTVYLHQRHAKRCRRRVAPASR